MKSFLFFLRLGFGIFSLLFSNQLLAQSSGVMEVLKSDGKIYVVLIVSLIILLGLLFYAMGVNRKWRKVEHEIKAKKNSTD